MLMGDPAAIPRYRRGPAGSSPVPALDLPPILRRTSNTAAAVLAAVIWMRMAQVASQQEGSGRDRPHGQVRCRRCGYVVGRVFEFEGAVVLAEVDDRLNPTRFEIIIPGIVTTSEQLAMEKATVTSSTCSVLATVGGPYRPSRTRSATPTRPARPARP